MPLQRKSLSPLVPLRYARQHALEGVGEAGQKLFEETEVVCEGEGLALQTAAAYLEAAGFYLPPRTTHAYPGFRPFAWQKQTGSECLSAAALGCHQRGCLGQLPCTCADGVDFWVLLGCFQGAPGFLFARGQDKQPWLNVQLEALGGQPLEAAPAPAHLLVAAWAALAFEKLALGLLPEAGGGSVGPWGEAKLWEAP